MDHLRQAPEQTRNGQGQIVAVVGEPEVGTSRLSHEFKILSEKTGLILQTFCVVRGPGGAYLPLLELLRTDFQVLPQDDDWTVREKITGRIVALDCDLQDALPYLLACLGHPELVGLLQQRDLRIRQQRAFDGMRSLLLRESLNEPLFLIFEGLQWLNDETQAFPGMLAGEYCNCSDAVVGQLSSEIPTHLAAGRRITTSCGSIR